MGKIAILTGGTRGDVQPFIALGIELGKLGHSVLLVGPEDFEEFVTGAGLGFSRIRVGIRKLCQSDRGQRLFQSGLNPFVSFHRTLDLARPLIECIQEDIWYASQGASAIIDGLPIMGYDVAEALKTPYFEVQLQPRFTKDYPHPYWPYAITLGSYFNLATHLLWEYLLWYSLRTKVNNWRTRDLGLVPLSLGNPFARKRSAEIIQLNAFSEFVIPKPRDWRDSQYVTGYWFLDESVEYQPSQSLLDFLDSGPPPVYFGFGSMADGHAEELTELVLKVLQQTGLRGLLHRGWGGLEATALPDNVYVIDSIPHNWLLPRVSTVVCHGGAGTTASALRCGVPLIVIPFYVDQVFWGQRVFELGVGSKPIKRAHLTTSRLCQALVDLQSNDHIRENARLLAERIHKENGAARAASIIDQAI